MNVEFLNRDFSRRADTIPVDISVDQYSWHMIGGPRRAILTFPPSFDKWHAVKLLRCPVDIYADDGAKRWWGFVSEVVIPHGSMSVGLSLATMANRVRVSFANLAAGSSYATERLFTAWAEDSVSTDEYGDKEIKFGIGDSLETAANEYRDTYLENHKYPIAEIRRSNRKTVTITCHGWWETLGWKYFYNGGTSATEISSQIEKAINDEADYIDNVLVQDTTGISPNEYQAGDRTVLSVVENLLEYGTSNDRRYLARVLEDRTLELYEQPAEDDYRYVLKENGDMEWATGGPVKPSEPVVADWVRMANVPISAGGITDLRPFFVEEYTYYSDRDEAIYKPASRRDETDLWDV